MFPAALAQIVTSLVHDALSRTPAAGRSAPVVVWVDRVGDQIELGCRHDGSTGAAGLSPRSEPPSSGGKSLDLYIVHALVTDLLRGTVAARPTPERGHAIIIRFPATPP